MARKLRSRLAAAGVTTPAAVVMGLGGALRVVLWRVHFPIWKHFAAFLLFELPPLAYLGDFQSYSAVRMPFYDLFAAAGYLLTGWLFGVRSLTVFSLTVALVSLPLFYLGVRRLFDGRVALFALVAYALYPKMAVLVAQGFPEAASASFCAISLYTLARAEGERTRRRSMGWYALTGACTTLAFLVFVPAVFYAVAVSCYLYATERDRTVVGPGGSDGMLRALLPAHASTTYSAPPFVAGVIYLVFGPVATMLTTVSGGWTNMSTTLFRPGAEYGTLERVLRYVAYVFLDVWSFGRGYDKGHHVLRKLESLAAFTGPAFPVLMAGYLAVTVALTAVFFYGCYRLLRRRDALALTVVATVAGYAVLHTVRNAGWTGVLQTRHVFPYFPAAAVAFGVGAAALCPRLRALEVPRVAADDWPVVVLVALVLCFAPLVAVSTADARFASEHHRLEKRAPNAHLQSLVDEGDTVAVATVDEYHDTVLFTRNDVRPVVLVDGPAGRRAVETWTVAAERLRVAPSALSGRHADYFFLSECGPLTPTQRAYLDGARSNGTVVHSRTTRRGAGRCTVRTYVVRLET